MRLSKISDEKFATFPPEVQERRNHFNDWFRRKAGKAGFYELPSTYQGFMHNMMWAAFKEGAKYERKDQIVEVGGQI